jgi:selenide,water dikinase
MGARPISALSVVCYPQAGDWDVLARILEGGQTAMNAEGVVVIGGHSVDDAEIKIGYAVTGIVHPNKVVTNAGARLGDSLILTKPIGTGAINTAVKKGVAEPETERAAIATMTASAAKASNTMVDLEASACTDITGFGLLGHAYEMARASRVTIKLDSTAVPILPDVIKLIRMGMLTRGDKNNRDYVGNAVSFSASVSGEMQSALFDPQTAGGLLIALQTKRVEYFLNAVPGSAVIGAVTSDSEVGIFVN